MKNPAWEAAEKERLDAEKAYKDFMEDPATLQLREDDELAWREQIQVRNAAIDAANKKVRTTPQEIRK